MIVDPLQQKWLLLFQCSYTSLDHSCSIGIVNETVGQNPCPCQQDQVARQAFPPIAQRIASTLFRQSCPYSEQFRAVARTTNTRRENFWEKN